MVTILTILTTASFMAVWPLRRARLYAALAGLSIAAVITLLLLSLYQGQSAVPIVNSVAGTAVAIILSKWLFRRFNQSHCLSMLGRPWIL